MDRLWPLPPPRRIFISSTLRDLVTYRAMVTDTVTRLHQNADDMEHFGARPGGAIAASVNAVAEADIYLGIFAWRYGTIKPGEVHSITHLEYNEAVRRGLPRLIFLANATTEALSGPLELFPDALRDHEHDRQRQAFRRQLEADEVVEYFTTPEDLGRRAAIALFRLIPKVMPPQPLMPLDPPRIKYKVNHRVNLSQLLQSFRKKRIWLLTFLSIAVVTICLAGGYYFSHIIGTGKTPVAIGTATYSPVSTNVIGTPSATYITAPISKSPGSSSTPIHNPSPTPPSSSCVAFCGSSAFFDPLINNSKIDWAHMDGGTFCTLKTDGYHVGFVGSTTPGGNLCQETVFTSQNLDVCFTMQFIQGGTDTGGSFHFRLIPNRNLGYRVDLNFDGSYAVRSWADSSIIYGSGTMTAFVQGTPRVVAMSISGNNFRLYTGGQCNQSRYADGQLIWSGSDPTYPNAGTLDFGVTCSFGCNTTTGVEVLFQNMAVWTA